MLGHYISVNHPYTENLHFVIDQNYSLTMLAPFESIWGCVHHSFTSFFTWWIKFALNIFVFYFYSKCIWHESFWVTDRIRIYKYLYRIKFILSHTTVRYAHPLDTTSTQIMHLYRFPTLYEFLKNGLDIQQKLIVF